MVAVEVFVHRKTHPLRIGHWRQAMCLVSAALPAANAEGVGFPNAKKTSCHTEMTQQESNLRTGERATGGAGARDVHDAHGDSACGGE